MSSVLYPTLDTVYEKDNKIKRKQRTFVGGAILHVALSGSFRDVHIICKRDSEHEYKASLLSSFFPTIRKKNVQELGRDRLEKFIIYSLIIL